MAIDPGRARVTLMALAALLGGCAARIAYQPNEAMLDGLARPQREQMFVETLSRASKPRIVQVWIDDSSYGYDSAVAVRDGFGIPVGYTGRRRIVYFGNVRELRLYDNDAVFVVDTSGRVIDKLVFGYREDAQRMIDLIAAYRARRYAALASGRDDSEHPDDRRYERRRREPPPPPYDPRYGEPPPDYDDQGPYVPREDDGRRY